jgi:hypothetical protein
MNKPILFLSAIVASVHLLSGCFGGRTPPPRLHTLAPVGLWETFASRDAVTALADDIAAHLSAAFPSESGSGPHRRAAPPSKSTRKQKD